MITDDKIGDKKNYNVTLTEKLQKPTSAKTDEHKCLTGGGILLLIKFK